MEKVKKFVFWILLAVGIVVGGGAYFALAPNQEEIDKTRKTAEDKRSNLEKMVNKGEDIMTERHVSATQAYRSNLDEQWKKLTAAWESRKFDAGKEFSDASKKTPLEFESWLNDWRKLFIQKVVDKAKFTLPATFTKDYLYEGARIPEKDSERQDWVKRLVIIQEVVNTLIDTKVDVPHLKFNGAQEAKDELESGYKDGAFALDSIEITEVKLPVRTREWYRDALKFNKGTLVGDDKFPSPYTVTSVEVRFKTYLPAVVPVIQALENNSHWFGVVRKIDTARASAPLPGVDMFGKIPPGPKVDGAEDPPRINTYYQEGPVQVLVLLDLMQGNAKEIAQMGFGKEVKK